MNHHEDCFDSHDGLTLYETRWLPPGEPRAVVVFVHGFTEHSGRYVELAQTLNQHGYVLWAIDLRGHGKSQGHDVVIRCFDEYLDDLDLLLARVRAEMQGKPIFLMGHSMGGAVALLDALERKPPIDGLVASAAAVSVGSRVFPLLRRLAAVVARLFPRLRLVCMGSGRLSRDPDVVRDFRNDPLVFHGHFPARTGSEILRAAQRIQDKMHRLALPLLILHGTGDMITDPEGSRRLFQTARSPDKTLALYDKLYHDLLHEPEKDLVTADVLAWLGARS